VIPEEPWLKKLNAQVRQQLRSGMIQQDDGKTLVMMAEEGGCSKVDAQVTKQTADEVDITLLTVATTQKICPQYIRNVPVAAHLDAPLGTRKVVLAMKTGVQR